MLKAKSFVIVFLALNLAPRAAWAAETSQTTSSTSTTVVSEEGGWTLNAKQFKQAFGDEAGPRLDGDAIVLGGMTSPDCFAKFRFAALPESLAYEVRFLGKSDDACLTKPADAQFRLSTSVPHLASASTDGKVRLRVIDLHKDLDRESFEELTGSDGKSIDYKSAKTRSREREEERLAKKEEKIKALEKQVATCRSNLDELEVAGEAAKWLASSEGADKGDSWLAKVEEELAKSRLELLRKEVARTKPEDMEALKEKVSGFASAYPKFSDQAADLYVLMAHRQLSGQPSLATAQEVANATLDEALGLELSDMKRRTIEKQKIDMNKNLLQVAAKRGAQSEDYLAAREYLVNDVQARMADAGCMGQDGGFAITTMEQYAACQSIRQDLYPVQMADMEAQKASFQLQVAQMCWMNPNQAICQQNRPQGAAQNGNQAYGQPNGQMQNGQMPNQGQMPNNNGAWTGWNGQQNPYGAISINSANAAQQPNGSNFMTYTQSGTPNGMPTLPSFNNSLPSFPLISAPEGSMQFVPNSANQGYNSFPNFNYGSPWSV